MVEPPDAIVEVREELMVSPNGANPNVRKAHFLKPTATSIENQILEPLSSHSLFSAALTSSEPEKLPLRITFNGWLHPQEKWKTWVNGMHYKYQSTWMQAGIYKAIMGSTYRIEKETDLVLGLAEKWCSETNTFIFPWGAATITLEDMILLGGYPVLGSPVFTPLESMALKEIEGKLNRVWRELVRTNAKKANPYAWMRHFMENERKFEHEAFLSLWLSRFVFPSTSVSRRVFPIAIHLARGTKIALAPAVLASIYRDLSLLKEKIVASIKLDNEKVENDCLAIALWAPFQLLYIWAWERFMNLRQNPISVEYGEPRATRCYNMKKINLDYVRLALDSAREFFQWRPYATELDNWWFDRLFNQKEGWVLVNPGLDGELESFARCLRACELVGIDCIEQYLPHVVAMQFGMDQDLPGYVTRCNESAEIAWNDYNRPINHAELYILSPLLEPGVTTRYLEWWKEKVWGQQCEIIGDVQWQGSAKSSERSPESSKAKSGNDNVSVPPGFVPKFTDVEAGDSVVEDKPTLKELLRFSKEHTSSDGKHLCRAESQCLSSSSTADDGVARKIESLKKPIEKIKQSEYTTERSRGTVDKANEDRPGNPTCKMESLNDNEGESSCGTFEKRVLKLEARISKLERVIIELRAERFGDRVGKKPTRGLV